MRTKKLLGIGLGSLLLLSLVGFGTAAAAQHQTEAEPPISLEKEVLCRTGENGLQFSLDGNSWMPQSEYEKEIVKQDAEGIWDGNVNKPDLMSGMSAIKFTEPTDSTEGKDEKVSDSSKNDWYNYSEKKWANAQTEDGSMWVWIPRYAYKINKSNQTFDVVFLVGTTDNYYDKDGKLQTAKRQTSETDIPDATKDYVVHPAFTNESNIGYVNGGWKKELTGIWVSKFEAGYFDKNLVDADKEKYSKHSGYSVQAAQTVNAECTHNYKDTHTHNGKSVHVHDEKNMHTHDEKSTHTHHGHIHYDGTDIEEKHIHDLCEQEHCNCEDGIWMSALKHTLKITVFILAVSFVLNIIIGIAGEDAIGRLLGDVPFLGEAMAALIGLIPNCAPSVIITELYLDGMLSSGAMMSGLLVSAGVGLLVLFRMNRHRLKENIMVVGTLYVTSVCWGLLINLLGITF